MREKKEDEEKKLQNQKSQKEEAIKKLDSQISQVKSDIEKHKDALISLQSNQEFLLKLSGEKFNEHRKAEINRKEQAKKLEWIEEHKNNPDLDYDIVFKDDDDIHDNEKMEFSFLN